MRVVIAGAGIGGLTAAMALAAAGHEVTVYESTRELKPLGVGINLLPHAGEVLQRLGVLERIIERGIATRELLYFNKFGQQIWREPRGLEAGFAVPQISIHRGVLQMTLAEAARERVNVVMDRRVVHVEEHGVAHFESRDGQRFTVEADLIVAADGIHSAVRRQFHPDEGPPRYSGRLLWRGVTRAKPFLTGASMFMAGHPDLKFVAYPIEQVASDGTQLINWIAELPRPAMLERESWSREGNFADFAPAFSTWMFDWLDVPALIAGASAAYEFPMVDRDPLTTWTHGRVTLLGDAAHPMYPVGSNGASQAILDSDALVNALKLGDVKYYEQQRLPATAAIVLMNRRNGPEQCMQWAEERAPNGFTDIETVIPRAELEALAAQYRRTVGLKKKD
ncbi:MAG: flavin-dependent oxidoreductase [Archangium sp.]